MWSSFYGNLFPFLPGGAGRGLLFCAYKLSIALEVMELEKHRVRPVESPDDITESPSCSQNVWESLRVATNIQLVLNKSSQKLPCLCFC